MGKICMKRKNILVCILAAIAMLCFCFGLASCKKGSEAVLSFDDGTSITINIGETKMLSFSCTTELSASNKASITSSDESVVITDKKGYITAVGPGSAEVTLKAEGIDSTAKITVTVAVPEIKAENRYYINVDKSKYSSLFAELDESVAGGTSVYLETYKGSELVGIMTAKAQVNHRVYFPLDEMKVDNGVYKVGLACVSGNGNEIKRVFLTDAVASYSLIKAEGWSLSNVEFKADGKIGLIDENAGFGGATLSVPIEKDENGAIVNPRIYIRAEEGVVWAVKIRRGNGIDLASENVVLADCAVNDTYSCTIDLTKYPNYVRDGQITLVIFAVGGDLKIGDIINYTGNYVCDAAVKESEYNAIQSVDISVPEKLYVGYDYAMKIHCTPYNASFKDFEWVTSNDNVTLLDSGRIKVNKAGECELSCVGTDGTVYGSVTLNGLIKVEKMAFETTSGRATVLRSAGRYDLSNLFTIYPTDASDKLVTYEITSSTVNGAAVDEKGIVTFNATGVITIAITSKDNTDASKTFTLTVVDSFTAVSSVKIGQTSKDINIGDELMLSATVLPDNATDKSIIWTSTNEAVATVENGKVTALKAGTVTISAFSTDGAAYDNVTITVHAVTTVSIDPAKAKYGCIELGDEILTGDKVTVKVSSDKKEYTIVENKEIPEAEKDAKSAGSMVVQRRIFFALDSAVFASNGQYKFEVSVTRNGEALQAYSFGGIKCYENKPLTASEWNDGYNCTVAVSDGTPNATLNADGYGYVALKVSVSELKNANYLFVNIPEGTATKISVKIGANDFALTIGDCTSYGCYKFDLTEYLATLKNEETVELKVFLIGERNSTATIGQIVLASEI